MNLGATASKLSPLRVAYGLAAIKLLVHALTLRPYGFFRDELYYIACSDHLDWGYVDQPPFLRRRSIRTAGCHVPTGS